MIKKLIPSYYYNSIYDIDYDMLYNKGIRLILTDLDNTLISYKQSLPTDDLKSLINNLKEKGFEIIIVSNSSKGLRAKKFAEILELKYTKMSLKPLKHLASRKYLKSEIILFGDQLMTDIFGANRAKINSILVKPIDKLTDILPTRINRRLERHYLKKIMKKYPDAYKDKLEAYVEASYDNKKM
jgi:hypothetical protein